MVFFFFLVDHFSGKKNDTQRHVGHLESHWHMNTIPLGSFLLFWETGENKITPGPSTKWWSDQKSNCPSDPTLCNQPTNQPINSTPATQPCSHPIPTTPPCKPLTLAQPSMWPSFQGWNSFTKLRGWKVQGLFFSKKIGHFEPFLLKATFWKNSQNFQDFDPNLCFFLKDLEICWAKKKNMEGPWKVARKSFLCRVSGHLSDEPSIKVISAFRTVILYWYLDLPKGAGHGWCSGCRKTPSLRLKKQHTLEDAGIFYTILPYTHIHFPRISLAFCVFWKKNILQKKKRHRRSKKLTSPDPPSCGQNLPSASANEPFLLIFFLCVSKMQPPWFSFWCTISYDSPLQPEVVVSILLMISLCLLIF